MRKFFPVLVSSLLAGNTFVHALPAELSPVPLRVGESWTYQGVVKWIESKNQVKLTNIKWVSTIERVIPHTKVTVALVRGFPTDLEFYKPKLQPSLHALIWTGKELYHLNIDEMAKQKSQSNLLTRLTSPSDALTDVLKKDYLLIKTPLRDGTFYGSTAPSNSTSDFWRWNVKASKSPLNLPLLSTPATYWLTFSTNRDSKAYNLLPGIGFISYRYLYRDKSSEVDVHLVDHQTKFPNTKPSKPG